MFLLELLEENIIKVPLASKSKDDVLKELVSILKRSPKIKNSKIVLKEVLKREELSSTGLGQGIAIPHAKTTAVEGINIALGISSKGIDFDALDGQDTFIFFLIVVSPDQANLHLNILSDIAGLAKDPQFCKRIVLAKSSAEVLDIFNSFK